ncbi:hypothetical protein CRUP_019130 [Coryphaenoides rupestris]|nr:hypothetical protein CRUP_019130 [Coryphaenoides rupestris]
MKGPLPSQITLSAPAAWAIVGHLSDKNIVRITVEQSVVLQSRIKARVLVLLATEGLDKTLDELDQKKFTPALLQGYRELNGVVVTVPGDHHVHLNHPEIVAPVVSDFLQSNDSAHSADDVTAKL